jgi:hypothetical protein
MNFTQQMIKMYCAEMINKSIEQTTGQGSFFQKLNNTGLKKNI